MTTLTNLLPSWPLLSAFLGASLVLAITPGPGVAYIIARSLTQGRRAGLISTAGVALGNFGNACAASIGLAAVFAVSSVAFTLVKYLGALYLIYLGLQLLRSTPANITAQAHEPVRLAGVFRDGFIVALLNPKTTLFFATFLPQFLNPMQTPMFQSVLLGSLFVAIAAATDSMYALGAGSFAPFLTRSRKSHHIGRYLGGCAFIGLGLYTALSGARSAK